MQQEREREREHFRCESAEARKPDIACLVFINNVFPGFSTSQNKKVTDKAKWITILSKASLKRNLGDVGDQEHV